MDTEKTEKSPLEDSFKLVDSSRNGLSEKEAKVRLDSYGYNEIKAKKKSSLITFLSKFLGPIPVMLEFTLVASYVLEDYAITYIILAMLIFNAIIGFIEEHHATSAIELLKARLTLRSIVLRNGEWIHAAATYLVPGDVIRLKAGDIVPADCRIIDNEAIMVDESVLTGESLPSTKTTGKLCFSGSLIKRGEATALVLSTGKNTYFGKIVELVKDTKTKTRIEGAVMGIVKRIMAINAFLIVIVAIYALVIAEPLSSVVPFILVLMIGSVPVALPVAFTVAMALGTRKLLDKGVLLTKLSAIEEASTINVLCLDKTGTITENRLVLGEPVPNNGFSAEDVVALALLTVRKEDQDPIDNAILEYAKAHRIKTTKYKVEKVIPFDVDTKSSSAIVIYKGKKMTISKGSVTYLNKGLNKDVKQKMDAEADNLSKGGLRTIAVSIKEGSVKRLAGLLTLYDKPRANIGQLIKELNGLGLSIKMLTGDNVYIARHIAKEIGMGGEIVEIDSIKNKTDKVLSAIVNRAAGFADVLPENKYSIVNAIQNGGFSVGMTGDGINDAPALEKAQVGIAVSNATDIARASANVVLTLPGLGVIIDTIKESRKIFERMITYTVMKIVKIVQIVFFLSIAFIALGFLPILPLQLVALVFLNDVSSITLATDNEQYSNKPDAWDVNAIVYASSIMGGLLLIETIIFSILGLYIFNMGIPAFQTFLFLVFDVSIELTIFSIRERGHFWHSRPSNALLLATILGMALGAVMAYFGILMQSISISEIASVFAVSILSLLAIDEIKVILFKKFSEFKR